MNKKQVKFIQNVKRKCLYFRYRFGAIVVFVEPQFLVIFGANENIQLTTIIHINTHTNAKKKNNDKLEISNDFPFVSYEMGERKQ